MSGSASRKSARNADGARKPSRPKSSRSAGEASHAACTRARSSGRGSALPTRTKSATPWACHSVVAGNAVRNVRTIILKSSGRMA